MVAAEVLLLKLVAGRIFGAVRRSGPFSLMDVQPRVFMRCCRGVRMRWPAWGFTCGTGEAVVSGYDGRSKPGAGCSSRSLRQDEVCTMLLLLVWVEEQGELCHGDG